jgi:hypothetical protein
VLDAVLGREGGGASGQRVDRGNEAHAAARRAELAVGACVEAGDEAAADDRDAAQRALTRLRAPG